MAVYRNGGKEVEQLFRHVWSVQTGIWSGRLKNQLITGCIVSKKKINASANVLIMWLFTKTWNLSSGNKRQFRLRLRSQVNIKNTERVLLPCYLENMFFIRRCSIHHTHPLGFPFHNALGCRGSRFKFQFQLTFYLSFRSVFETWLPRHEPICCNLQSQWLTGANEENTKEKSG